MSHILIVDDDSDIRFALSEVLKANGYIVSVAANGEGVGNILDSQDIDLILLDIFMPDKDGFETIGDIRRSNRRDVRIVAMSGYGEAHFNPLEHARLLGVDESLSKPFSPDELLSTLQRLLGHEKNM